MQMILHSDAQCITGVRQAKSHIGEGAHAEHWNMKGGEGEVY